MTKKILIFSLGPIFKDYVHGGSQKVLREVALYLGQKGHKVDIYCVKREDNLEIFELGTNVKVYPVMEFKQTFPLPYKTSPFNLYKIIKILKEQIDKHDVFYIHDGGLNFTFLCNQEIPTVISLRDFLYQETLVGAFNFRRDQLIVNSKHSFDCLKYTVGNYLPQLEERINLIENGIDIDLFKYKTPNKILSLMEKEIKEKDLIVIYPHRPDPSKGINQVLELITRLKFKRGLEHIKLLIPKYIDENVSNDLDEHYENILKIAKEKNIDENIIFHQWVPYELMPEYYSLGKLTLSIGNFIEAFGSNVALESFSCGTPVIMSRVGAQRTTLPEKIIPKIDFGDLDSAEEIAYKILMNQINFDTESMRDFISKNFSHQKMLESYEKIICNAKITPLLKMDFLQKNIDYAKVKIAPWCVLTKKGIYNDYLYGYTEVSKEVQAFLKAPSSNIEESLKEKIRCLMDGGFLVN
jgi:glycosyltransferase involved in cell wall biosynthesis